MDACVLIDFAKADSSLITITAHHLGEVYVAAPVFEEVHDLDPAMADSLGIKVFEPTLEMVVSAASNRGRLSFQDRLCLIIAKENGWTCISNDKRLRADCMGEGVSVMWGFEVLALLVERRALEPMAARDLAKTIAAANKRIGRDVLQRFFARIRVKD
jgi:hypothetical protein